MLRKPSLLFACEVSHVCWTVETFSNVVARTKIYWVCIMCWAMVVITLWSQHCRHRVTGEKTRSERVRDICENTPELQRCPVSYKEVSTFWLISAQAGGLPAASVSHPGNWDDGCGYSPQSQLRMHWSLEWTQLRMDSAFLTNSF